LHGIDNDENATVLQAGEKKRSLYAYDMQEFDMTEMFLIFFP